MNIETTFPSDTATVRAVDSESLTVHWRAVFAGIFISLLVYVTLLSLGAALGATYVKDVVDGAQSVQGLGPSAGIWMTLTVLISLFVGSYASGRISGVIATRVGYMQGAVISALFFVLMLTQIGISLGAIGSGIGAVGRTLFSASEQIATNPAVAGVVEDTLNEVELTKSSPSQVATGLMSRMLRGDTDSALNFLVSQTNLSREEANARYQALNAKVTAITQDAARKAADTTRQAGWFAFSVMAAGTLFAMFGGAIGAQVNIRHPIGSFDRRAYAESQKVAYV